ncbi:MAG: hypothetical protein JW987_10740, partial [Anaerolineaceae bacterium]|nr:hypothetical protein [Anaerolineaceae bacterium]
PATYTWFIDTTDPNTTITTNPADPSNVTSPTFAFSGTDNHTDSANLIFHCSLDSAAFAACTSPLDLGPLPAGSHTFSVYAIDEANNPDASPATYTWFIDTTPPDIVITSGPADPTNETSGQIIFTNSDSTATLSCLLDSQSQSTCSSPFNLSDLDEGEHTFTITATDPAGNTDSASHSWFVDITPPNTIIDSGPDILTNDPDADFNFSGSDTHSLEADMDFMCKLDDASYTNCNTPLSLVGLPEGSHIFYVYAIDAAGNADTTPATFTWTIDTTVPDVTITGSPADPTNSNTALFTFIGENVVSFTCSLDGSPETTCSSPMEYLGVAVGSHTFSVYGVDGSGNRGSDSFTWFIDTTPPTTTITANPAALTNDPDATFEFSGDDNHSLPANLSFMCKLDTADFATCENPVDLSSLPEGSHTFSVYAIDEAVNSDASPSTFTWVVDLTSPTATSFVRSIPTAQLTNADELVFQVTFSEAVENVGTTSFAVDGDSTASVSTVSGSGTTYLVTVSGGDLANFNGEVGLNFSTSPGIEDEAGNAINTTEPGTDQTYFLDNEAPTTTITGGPAALSSTDSATFTFTGLDNESSTADLTYKCSLDGGAFENCTSPKTYTGLAIGEHTFEVHAIDELGHVDATPATFTWTVAHKIFLPLVRR